MGPCAGGAYHRLPAVHDTRHTARGPRPAACGSQRSRSARSDSSLCGCSLLGGFLPSPCGAPPGRAGAACASLPSCRPFAGLALGAHRASVACCRSAGGCVPGVCRVGGAGILSGLSRRVSAPREECGEGFSQDRGCAWGCAGDESGKAAVCGARGAGDPGRSICACTGGWAGDVGCVSEAIGCRGSALCSPPGPPGPPAPPSPPFRSGTMCCAL